MAHLRRWPDAGPVKIRTTIVQGRRTPAEWVLMAAKWTANGSSGAANGERRLSSYLDRELIGHATVLHDIRVPKTRTRIDHLVVAPSGIWVINARNDSGKVECHSRGARLKSDPGLFVASRNRTRLVRAMRRRTDAVTRTLAPIGLSKVPIHRCLCFTNADWRFFSRPFSIEGVWIGWPRALAAAVRVSRVLDPPSVATLAQHLDAQLPGSG